MHTPVDWACVLFPILAPHVGRARWIRLAVGLSLAVWAFMANASEDGSAMPHGLLLLGRSPLLLLAAVASLSLASWRFGDLARRHDVGVGDGDGFGPAATGLIQSVAVVVLGDAGRSPRMQYHTLSLAKSGRAVTLVGMRGETLPARLRDHPRIATYLMPDLVAALPMPCGLRKRFRIMMPVKVVVQTLQLLWALLLGISRPDAILLQLPPSIPTLLVVWVVAVVRPTRIVVDWHNFGYTILALKLRPATPGGPPHRFVRFLRWYESVLGPRMDAHLCVTAAMRRWLHDNWHVRGCKVLYDRPPDVFRRLGVAERESLFTRLRADFAKSERLLADVSGAPRVAVAGTEREHDTLFTTRDAHTKDGRCPLTLVPPGKPVWLRADRPALVISSTSWTPDEDFGVLLDAIIVLDDLISRPGSTLPNFVFVITGKGPQKAMYVQRIAGLGLKHVDIHTLWLEADDYPRLLGSADLGVCLHTSSSGLDLPMKVVDMFGAGLPVCAIGFKCLGELVRHEHNGLIFSTAKQLAQQLSRLFEGFPGNSPELDRLSEGVKDFQQLRWEDNWRAVAAPCFADTLEPGAAL